MKWTSAPLYGPYGSGRTLRYVFYECLCTSCGFKSSLSRFFCCQTGGSSSAYDARQPATREPPQQQQQQQQRGVMSSMTSSSDTQTTPTQPVEFDHAIIYVNKIKVQTTTTHTSTFVAK